METVEFENQTCYVGYKGLTETGGNFKKNFVYTPNNWYKTLDVDLSNVECSYGINLCYEPLECLRYGKYIYKVYIPVNQDIYFGKNKFRCKLAYIGELVDFNVDKYWSVLSEFQKELVCIHQTLDVNEYWSVLNEHQKELVCMCQTIDVDEYWSVLSEHQKDIVCRCQTIDVDKYWSVLSKFQKDIVCRHQTLDVDKYWSVLSESQKKFVCQHQILNVDKYWSVLSEDQKECLKKRIVIKL